jgi:hypothetical protein
MMTQSHKKEHFKKLRQKQKIAYKVALEILQYIFYTQVVKESH